MTSRACHRLAILACAVALLLSGCGPKQTQVRAESSRSFVRTLTKPGLTRAKLILSTDSKSLSVEGTASTKMLARVSGASTGIAPAFRDAGMGDDEEFSFGVPEDWETSPTSDGAGASRTSLVLSQKVEWNRLMLVAHKANSIDVDLTANLVRDVDIVAIGQVVVRLSDTSIGTGKYGTAITYQAPEYSKLTLVVPHSVTVVVYGRETPVPGAIEGEKDVWILRGTGRKSVLVQDSMPLGAVGEPEIAVERLN
jgi:hypothetical protein